MLFLKEKIIIPGKGFYCSRKKDPRLSQDEEIYYDGKEDYIVSEILTVEKELLFWEGSALISASKDLLKFRELGHK